MVAGNPAAVAALRDDEASPAMHRAAENFLRADQGILAITRAQLAMYALRAQAQQMAATYRGFGAEIVQARATAGDLLQRQQQAARSLASYARAAYRTGGVGGAGGGPDLASLALVGPADQDALGLVGVTGRLEDSLTRAELRVGWLSDRQAQVRSDFAALSVRYQRAAKALADANARLNGLAAARAAALSQVQAARSSDLALNRARLAASGNLGAQIRAAVAALARSGRTVTGTGDFARPGRGSVTSPFGMRYHPILHYVKLHTGTDFAPANGIAYAADDGRVLFTMVSPAYGNMTVIDHGIVHGKHITTLYCHQARFLVREGEVVHKGQPIGIIGATGWATGP
ncbi:MAG TPA: M23 family metallopeptidase, partial [Candidatus Eisenbacteria bacterium]|nr:M23 family metallopeptidase [Candidatus Eisenbacteria bacterium]